MECTDGWFEVQDGKMEIWEGVCAVYSATNVGLYKLRDSGQLYSMDIDCKVSRVTSTGYWSCVELNGLLSPDLKLLYHALDVSSATKMLEMIVSAYGALRHLVVRLDDDPLRLEDKKISSRRVIDWLTLINRFSERTQLIVDREMPL